jgi:hypothetical protein
MLQAGRSRVLFVRKSLDFFSLPNPSSHTMALGLTHFVREMSTRFFPGGNARRTHNLANLPPSVSRLCRKYGSLDITTL